MRWTTKEQNNALINKIACAIDEAENSTLYRLGVNAEMAGLRNASQSQEKL